MENQITLDIMKKANEKAILNPCPPFYRGEEITFNNYFIDINHLIHDNFSNV